MTQGWLRCGRDMLDYNSKFDRREPAVALSVEEIHELTRSHLPDSQIESVSFLAGGFMNSNYRVVLRDRTSLVLRISSRRADFKKELSVLKHVQGVVPVPGIIAEDFSALHSFVLMEFIEGSLFSELLYSLKPDDLAKIAFDAGGTLQTIHSFDLGQSGFFDENLLFNPAFENFGGSFYNYIRSHLAAGRVRERLGQTLANRALEWVGAKREVYWSVPNTTRLIHCDYNLKNILIRRGEASWKVAGILDWEFAMAGSPLVDIGNFLRFEDELPAGFSEAFVRGYVSNGMGLPNNWKEVAKLLDFAAMINFLEDEMHREPFRPRFR